MPFHRTVGIVSILLTLHNVGTVPRSLNEGDLAPVVRTGAGSIRGLRAEDGDYSMYMGVPYAQVDRGNPFGNSAPNPVFEDIFDAFDDSAICPQIEEFNNTVVGTLDCLHLNIYVPDSASTQNPLPVMVWIYGGGVNQGFAGRFLYGPSFIVRHDVILVTINYRVGPYGFMCLDIPEVPGNQGLKDQLLALRWINDNIAAFGGDASKITLFANSAGGMCADLLLYYRNEQLFHRIVPQSGHGMVNNMVRQSSPTAAIELAEYFNYSPNDVNDALAFLATIDAHDIIAGTNAAGLYYGACVEKQFDNVENFITTHPLNLETLSINDIDILVGFNNDEQYAGFSRMDEESLANLDIVSNVLNTNFFFGEENELYEEMREILNGFYFGDVTADRRRIVTDVSADFVFNHPAIRSAKKYLDDGARNVYLYMFSYDGGRNFVKHRNNITGGGANHADEIGYLFDISYMEKPLNPEDQLIMDRMTELWTNFAKYGNPTPAPTELVPLNWPPVTADQWHYMEIDSELQVGTRPMSHRMAFLDLFYRMNDQYRRGLEHAPSAGRSILLDISLPLLFAVIFFCRTNLMTVT